MTKKRLRDRILLLLAIKPLSKVIDFNHIYEKIHRDCGATKNEIRETLENLIAEGLVEKAPTGYKITEIGRQEAQHLAFDP